MGGRCKISWLKTCALKPLILTPLLLILLSSSCSSLVQSFQSNSSPEGVVERFYMALQKNDQDTMLDCIDPDLRVGIDPYGSIGLPGVDCLRIVLEKLEEKGKKLIELSKMRYKVLDNDGTVAHVQVNGRVKILDIGLVREFQLVHRTIKKNGHWYLTSPGNDQ